MMGLFDIFNGKKAERLEKRLDDIEAILRELELKNSELGILFNGVERTLPHQKGPLLNRLEERLTDMKHQMLRDAVLAECLEPKSYAEMKRRVRNKTGLAFSESFFDQTLRRLTYENKLTRIGQSFMTTQEKPKPLVRFEDAHENELVTAIAIENGHSKPKSTDSVFRIVFFEMLEELEKKHPSIPVPLLLEEARKRGIDPPHATQLLDESLMVTGQLYEPQPGHVKLVHLPP